MSEFKEFPKISRLNRGIVITEKLDGTNAAIIIERFLYGHHAEPGIPYGLVFGPVGTDGCPSHEYTVTAQSRNRILTVEKGKDNFGFAAWVARHAADLIGLGEGYHYGEWYGHGIQRTYGLAERRFALFNVLRWKEDEEQAKVFKAVQEKVPNLELVPLLYRGPWSVSDDPEDGGDGQPYDATDHMIARLRYRGSVAVPGFLNPEGVVVFHTASRQNYKVTCEKDEVAKGSYPGMHNQREENVA